MMLMYAMHSTRGLHSQEFAVSPHYGAPLKSPPPKALVSPPSSPPAAGSPTEEPLAEDVLALKELIQKTHRSKNYQFSLTHLRRIAVPPVQIPREYRGLRARSMLVGGHRVPYTRDMWHNCKRKHRPRLDIIHEHVVYD